MPKGKDLECIVLSCLLQLGKLGRRANARDASSPKPKWSTNDYGTAVQIPWRPREVFVLLGGGAREGGDNGRVKDLIGEARLSQVVNGGDGGVGGVGEGALWNNQTDRRPWVAPPPAKTISEGNSWGIFQKRGKRGGNMQRGLNCSVWLTAKSTEFGLASFWLALLAREARSLRPSFYNCTPCRSVTHNAIYHRWSEPGHGNEVVGGTHQVWLMDGCVLQWPWHH